METNDINDSLPPINLWLDDDVISPSRRPPVCGLDWTWAKTADEAIDLLKTGRVVWASLDHDLADEHYIYYHSHLKKCHDAGKHQIDESLNPDMCRVCGLLKTDENWDRPKFREKTGMSVIDYIDEHNVLPKYGIRIHTMNGPKKVEMLSVVNKLYGQTFQVQYFGTHKV